jgi:ribonucleoside-diphosphate reductase alpha chain
MPSTADSVKLFHEAKNHSTPQRKRFHMSATQQIGLTSEDATARTDDSAQVAEPATDRYSEPLPAIRRRLPDERRALTHPFSIAGQEGYLTVGVYEDGLPGEIFITMAKQGSTISGLMDSFATAVSLALQYSVPLDVLCAKLTHVRFEPSLWSGNPKIGYAKSIVDYIFRWLELKFTTGDQGELFNAPPLPTQAAVDSHVDDPIGALGELIQMGDAPACNICGSLMVRSGTCYRCMTCGSTSGCS